MENGFDTPALLTSIGRLVQRASTAEVTLQIAYGGIHGGVMPRFWRKQWSELVKECRKRLKRDDDFSDTARDGLLEALDRCESGLEARNRIIHDLWTWDEQGRPVQIVKADHGGWRRRIVSVEEVMMRCDELDRASRDLLDQVVATIEYEKIKPILDALAFYDD